MTKVPYKHNYGQTLTTDISDVSVLREQLAHILIKAPVAIDTDGVLTAVTDTGEEQVITTGITSPDFPRNITATAGGTAGDIKAIQVIVTGTNYADEVISETLPAFTVDTAGTVTGSLAFKTITSITIPAHDGTGATTAIGWGKSFGLPYKLPYSTLLKAFFDTAVDTGTITADLTDIEKNVFTVNGSPNGVKDINLYMIV